MHGKIGERHAFLEHPSEQKSRRTIRRSCALCADPVNDTRCKWAQVVIEKIAKTVSLLRACGGFARAPRQGKSSRQVPGEGDLHAHVIKRHIAQHDGREFVAGI